MLHAWLRCQEMQPGIQGEGGRGGRGRRRPSASSAETQPNHECLHNQLLTLSSEEEARLMRKAETGCVHLKESQDLT